MNLDEDEGNEGDHESDSNEKQYNNTRRKVKIQD